MISTENIYFILDLDGTIIGDCAYQVIMHELECLAKMNKIKSKFNNALLDHYHPQSKLIRPFFRYFIFVMKKHYPNCKFFVYTASEKSWAHKEIAFIEKTHRFKFNRPIFTRDDCILDSHGQYKKSVKKVLPKILKSSKKLITSPKIVVIDNNATFIDYAASFLLCPTYDFLKFCDLSAMIDSNMTRVHAIKERVSTHIASKKICKYIHTNHDEETIESRHKWLYKKYKRLNSYNKPYKNDDFWKRLANSIITHKMTSFDTNDMKILSSDVCNN